MAVQFPLADVADAMLAELRRCCPAPRLRALTGHQLMAERSRLANLQFKPGVSAGGSCCLLDTAQHPVAVNLPRDGDWASIPAWLETRDTSLTEPGNWRGLREALRGMPTNSLVDRARSLGLAVAATGQTYTPGPGSSPTFDESGDHVPGRPPVVVDLSALWAGPLASHLLWLGGADVIKVESTTRPDGGRYGSRDFYDLLNQGKRSVALPLHRDAGQRTLHRLLASADIVIESSRPRALRQMGIHAEDMLTRHPRLTWVSITGYGRQAPADNWVAYGDDAGIAAGMGDLMHAACGTWEFAGDAIADPLTGIQAALAAMHGWRIGGAGLVDIALADVVAWARQQSIASLGEQALHSRLSDWWQSVRSAPPAVERRAIVAPVAQLGEHTAEILGTLAIPCC